MIIMPKLADIFQDPGINSSDICYYDGIKFFLLYLLFYWTTEFLGDFVVQSVFLLGLV